MTTATEVRDAHIEQVEAEWHRLTALHAQAVAELAESEPKVASAESAYGDLLLDPDASTTALTKAFKALESAKDAREVLRRRAEAINAKGVEVETERADLITKKMREQQQAELAAIYAEAEAINREFLESIKKTYREIPEDILPYMTDIVSLLWGTHELDYTIKIMRLQLRLQTVGEVGVGGTTPALPEIFKSGRIALMLARGELQR